MNENVRSSILSQYGTGVDGLSSGDVVRLQKEYGRNELPEKHSSLALLFLGQFKNAMVLILLGAVAVSLLLPLVQGRDAGHEELLNAGIILAIVLLNATFGFVQEWRAGSAIASLRKLSGASAKVRRNGAVTVIDAAELVPGDIFIVEAGDRISADARLVASASLEVDEASMTGESVPVSKKVDADFTPPKEGFSAAMLYAGTLVTRGSGEAIVTATALKTEIGKITSMVIELSPPPTPLQQDLKIVGRKIGLLVLGLCSIIFALGLLLGMPPTEVFFVAVTLAVAAVPEGLPAVVTICLAIGVQRMAKKRALVRRLDAVETLGSVTIICADKTGTMTENKMKVVEHWLTASGDQKLLIQAGASCNRAELPDIGDPTEVALLVYATEKKIDRLPIDEEEVPFTSEDKHMVTRHLMGDRTVRFLKGAPEVVATLAGGDKAKFLQQSADFSSQGLRVLGVAVDEGQGMQLLGLLAMMDPPRKEVAQAIVHARNAGIRTIMITGDHPATAFSVADRIGLTSDGVLTGADLDALSDEELKAKLETVSVFARVHPKHKVRILQVLQAQGEIVAMSGDGVNDAPALRQAHVGVGMGKIGTDTARESSSIVLVDDHYATIVLAVAEGRRIYDNIRKFILFLMRSNMGEVMTVTGAMMLGLPLPLLPLHILWVNLVTDSVPALALAAEPGDKTAMARPPRKKGEGIFTNEWSLLFIAGLLNAIVCLLVFFHAYRTTADLAVARAATLTALIVYQVLLAFSVRSRKSVFFRGFFGNNWLIVAVLVALGLQALLLLSPLGSFMSLGILSMMELALIVAMSLAGFVAFEGCKVLVYKSQDEDLRDALEIG